MQRNGRTQLLVTEIFHSIQGEGTHSGLPYVFIRLTGCNLRCSYCDTSYAFKGGELLDIDDIIRRVKEFDCTNVLITGGEPLLQRPTAELCRRLIAEGHRVSIETHGEVSIETVAPLARIIMDIKTPSSGMCREGFRRNLAFLKRSDEIKFVIASPNDYDWAKEIVRSGSLPCDHILFSAAQMATASPGTFDGISSLQLAERILQDRLPVRLQVQLHKILWGSDRRGI